MKNVIVTCGGTVEPIDDVRGITNFSTGRFGHEIAEWLAAYDIYRVRELCPKSTLERLGAGIGVTYEHFRSTEDLETLLADLPPSPIVIHSAAVADYRPIKHDGKISSFHDSLTLTMEKTPKLISQLRPRYGSTAFLVGFKLLSNVSENELIEAATKQLHENRLNMVIANDLGKLVNGEHPVLVITAEGGVFPYEGSRTAVAKAIAALIYKREQVRWFKSVEQEKLKSCPILEQRFSRALDFAKATNLLTDNSGNISVRSDRQANYLLVSPRAIDKSELSSAHAVPVEADVETRRIYHGAAQDPSAARPGRKLKPSIDTGMEAVLFEAFPSLGSIVHFHRGWGRMAVKTGYPYPCGVFEEAEEVIENVLDLPLTLGKRELSVELVHHGFLLGVNDETLAELVTQWKSICEEFNAHLEEVTPVPAPENLIALDEKNYQPIWDGLKIVGLVHNNPEATTVYLGEQARGSGLGRDLIAQLIEREHVIQTVNDCQVRDFYKRFGFKEQEQNGVYLLTPPRRVLKRSFY